jgi:hypothetical protein
LGAEREVGGVRVPLLPVRRPVIEPPYEALYEIGHLILVREEHRQYRKSQKHRELRKSDLILFNESCVPRGARFNRVVKLSIV